jgi:hypothetical protein
LKFSVDVGSRVSREVRAIQGGGFPISSVETSRLMFLSPCYLLADLRVTDGSRLRAYGLKAKDRVDVLLGHVR